MRAWGPRIREITILERKILRKKIIIKIEDEGRGEPHKLIEYTRTMSTIMILIII